MAILRRSHAKSKTGCQTCKARRIKCDEFRPSCMNCVRGERECDYAALQNDGSGEPLAPAFEWPESIDKACTVWKDCGRPPLAVISTPAFADWRHFSVVDLRYLYHLSLLAAQLDENGARNFCAWWSDFPIFLQIASQVDFVAHAMMVISARRLAFVTKTSHMLQDASRYQDLAVKGLRRALASFSQDNSDAVLCASILLLFQQKNWSEWKLLMEGCSAVTEQMQPWLRRSSFYSSLQYDCHAQPETASSSTSTSVVTTTTITSFSLPSSPLVPVPAIQVDSFAQVLTYLFEQGTNSLNQLSKCIKHNAEASATVRGLRDLLHIVVQERPPNGARWREDDQYRMTYPYANFMKPLFMSFLSIGDSGEPFLVATVAHIYAVNVALALAFEAINTRVFLPNQLKGIAEIGSWFRKKERILCSNCATTHGSAELMTFPMNALSIYQQWTDTESVN